MARTRDDSIKSAATRGDASHAICGNDNVINETIVIADAADSAHILDGLTNPVELEFQGFDTLALGRLFHFLASNQVSTSEHTIYVRGRDNHNGRAVSMVAKGASGVVDSYIRTVFANEIESKEPYDIGGSNATKERIAADEVTVYIDPCIFDALPTSHSYLRIYASSRKSQLDSDLTTFVRCNQIEAAITVAKLLANQRSSKLLFKYLNAGFPADIMELVCEAFRCLSRPCSLDEKLAVRVTSSLAEYVNRHITKAEFAVSVIYAIESLGYVAPAHATTRALFCDFMNCLLFEDSHCLSHRQLVWASLVAIARAPSPNLDMGLIAGFGNGSADFDGPLPRLVKEITDQQVRLRKQIEN
jgi:hypothetical protein